MLWAPTGLLCRTQLAGCAVPRPARDVAGPAKKTGAAVVVERLQSNASVQRVLFDSVSTYSVRAHLLWKTCRTFVVARTNVGGLKLKM